MRKHSEQISSFLSFLRQVQEESNAAADEERAANDETQDILHCIEFGENGYRDRAKLSGELQRVRRRRRLAKNRQAVAKPVCDWLRESQDTVKRLERLLGEVRKAEKNTENRYYVNRTDVIERTLGKPGGDEPGQDGASEED